jgi:creatinine amidohydrolase
MACLFLSMSIPIYVITDREFRSSIKKTSLAIIPVGSLEQHGEHLPVSTDSIIVDYIARRTAEQLRSFVLPVIPYGVSYEHKPMFNVSLSNSTLSSVMCDICSSLSENGIKTIIILNGHHGNTGALQYIGQILDGKISTSSTVYAINYWHLLQSDFDHAGYVETSLVLAISPELVKMKKAKPNSKSLLKSKVAYSSITTSPGALPRITGNGVWGDPRNATARKGKQFLHEIIKKLIQTILELD